VKLKQQLEDPARWRKFFKFVKIPNMKMMGTRLPGETAMAVCQAYCANHGDCKSISYSRKKGICTWSTLTFTYDMNFNAYLKRYHNKNRAHKFDIIPGMMYQEPSTTTKTTRSFNECKLECFLNEKCHMFSTSKTPAPGTCIMSAMSVRYDEDYDYFEKETIPQLPGEKAKITLLKEKKQALIKKVHAANVKIKAADKEAVRQSRIWRELEYKRRIHTESKGPAIMFKHVVDPPKKPCKDKGKKGRLGEADGCIDTEVPTSSIQVSPQA